MRLPSKIPVGCFLFGLLVSPPAITAIPSQPIPHQIAIRAHGTPAAGQYPVMELRYGGSVLTSWTVSQGDQVYTYPFAGTLFGPRFRVYFVNDLRTDTEDRDLFVDWLSIDGRVYASDSADVYSIGSWDPGAGCAAGYKRSTQLSCDGFFEYPTAALSDPTISLTAPANGATVSGIVPLQTSPSAGAGIFRVDFTLDDAPLYSATQSPFNFDWDSTRALNGSHRIVATVVDTNFRQASQGVNLTVANTTPGLPVTIRAWGTPASGTYPTMELKQGDTTIATWTVDATPRDYSAYVSGSLSGPDLRVYFVNDLEAGGQDRDLFVESLNANGIFYSSGSYTTGTWDAVTGCTPGYKRSNRLYCNGYFEYPTSTVRPTLAVNAPSSGASLSGVSLANLTAASPAGIVKAEFFVDGLFAYRTAGLPYTFSWDTTPLSDGTHTLTVRAVDRSDKANALSRSVQVTHAGVMAVPSSPSRVTVSGTQLRIEKRNSNGTLAAAAPYLIKGVTWSPTGAASRYGYNPADPLNPAGYTDYGFFFDWEGRDPQGHVLLAEWMRNRAQAEVGRDLPLIQQMNANTVRIFTDLGTDPAVYKAILDEFYRRGIMVVMTVASAKADYDSGRYLTVVELCKNHPAILMWALGNEWNLNRYYGTFVNIDYAIVFTEAAAKAIKAIDPNHPVSSSLGDRFTLSEGGPCGSDEPRSDISTIVDSAPSVDLWGLNVYRGTSFGPIFTQWRTVSNKPFYFSEFGTDSFATSSYIPPAACAAAVKVTGGSVNQALQSSFVMGLWNELKANLSANDRSKPAVGGFVHEFSDQLWKVGSFHVGLGGFVSYEGPDGVPGTADDDASYASYNADGFFLGGSHPDGVANEEYFGTVTADRQPKLVYNALKTLYAGLAIDTTPPSIPANLRLSSRTAGGFTAVWNSSSDNYRLGGYRVDLSTVATFQALVPAYANRDVGVSTSIVVTGLLPSTTYYFRLRAYDAAGNVSGNSTVLSVTQGGGDTLAPTVPSSVTVSGIFSSSFSFRWTASTDNVSVTTYRLDVSTFVSFASMLPSYTDRSLGNVISASVTGLIPGTTYYARLRAVDAAGNASASSASITVRTRSDTLAPSAPSGLAATGISLSSFTLAWTIPFDNVGVTAYRLDVSSGATFLTPLASYNNRAVGQVTSTVISGLAPGTTYYVRLRALDAAGNVSGNSAVLSTLTRADLSVPTVPSGVTLVSVALSSFTLRWNPSVDNSAVATYRLDVSTAANFASILAAYRDRLLGNVTTASVTGLVPGTTYYSRLRAVDSSGNASAASTAIVSHTLADTLAPTIPTGLFTSGIYSSSFTLRWTASTDNVGIVTYRLDVSTATNFASMVSAYRDRFLGNVLTVSVTGLTPGTSYYARLRAEDAAGRVSANSSIASAFTRSSIASLALLAAPAGPQVWFIQPRSGARVSGPVAISAQPGGPGKSYVVEFSVDGKLLATIGHAPYSYLWDSTREVSGTHVLEARVFDEALLSGQSQVVVTVQGGQRGGDGLMSRSGLESINPLGAPALGVEAAVTNVQPAPNPWRSDRGYAGQIQFKGMPTNGTLKLFTLDGHVIRTLGSSNNVAVWDLKNEEGQSVSSGLYLFLVEDPSSAHQRGKVVVIR